MIKKIILTFLVILFFSKCQKKSKAIEKTYEQLEAEVLCDVLPEIIQYDLLNSRWIKYPPPYPILEIDTLKFNAFQIESIINESKINWNNYLEQKRRRIKDVILNLKEFKKVEFGILDTLGWINKSNTDKTEYKFDSLGPRPLTLNEFKKSKIKISLITYENTFEGDIRNSDIPLLILSRVLLTKDSKKACLFVFKQYGAYYCFCVFSEVKNKWILKKIKKENNF